MKDVVRDLAVKRCIEAFFTGGVVEWSADGKTLYSSCSNVVKAINLDDNLSTCTIGDSEETIRITCICLDNVRSRLLVAYNNQTIREFTLPVDGKSTMVRMWKTMHEAPILIMRFSEDGLLLATGSADFSVKVWDLNLQQCSHTFKGTEVVSAICFVRGDRVLVGYIGGVVNMFDMVRGATKKLIHHWSSHTSQVTSIVQIPQSRKAAIFSRDRTVSIVETETRETLKVLPLFEPIESAVAVHNGNIVTVGEEGTIKEWMIDSGKLLKKKHIAGAALDSVSYNPIRNQLLTVSAEGNIFVLDLEDFRPKKQIVGFQDEVYSCALLGKDESHMAVASNTKEIRLYDATTWDCQLVQEGHKESILCVSTAEFDKSMLVSCSKDSTIIVWRLQVQAEAPATLQQIAIATGHTNTVNSVRFSRSAARPFLLSVSQDTTLKLWSLVDLDLKPKAGDISKIPCSSTLLAHGKEASCVNVSMTDNLCVTGGMDKLAKLWHIDASKMQLGIAGTLSGHRRGVADARFSPNAQKLATCSGDMTVKVWSLQDKTCLQTLTGHGSAVFNVMFVNHGTQLVSADSGGILKIWTLSTGESETSIEAHNDRIWTLCASANEGEYITSGTDGRIILWKDVSEEKILEEDKKRRQRIEEEQTLSNLLEQHRFDDALEFALGLVRPFCALKVVEQLIERDELTTALARLDKDKTQVLLDFATQWNTNSRTSQASQQVLNSLLLIHPPEELLKLPNINSVVQSFIPYTKRHMERLNKARQDVTLLKFTWDQMRLN